MCPFNVEQPLIRLVELQKNGVMIKLTWTDVNSTLFFEDALIIWSWVELHFLVEIFGIDYFLWQYVLYGLVYRYHPLSRAQSVRSHSRVIMRLGRGSSLISDGWRWDVGGRTKNAVFPIYFLFQGNGQEIMGVKNIPPLCFEMCAEWGVKNVSYTLLLLFCRFVNFMQITYWTCFIEPIVALTSLGYGIASFYI